MVVPGEFCNVVDGFISRVQKLCVRCRNVDKIIGSRIQDILPGFLQLEVHYFRYIGHTSGDKGKGHTDIVEDIFEHYF